MIKLTPRLQAVADLVNNCECFLDVGTDHAYLPAYIIQNKIALRAIASDINPNPLMNAKNTLDEEDLNESIELRLSAGLKNIKPDEAQEIAIAGMGGLMISSILEADKWVKNPNIHLILQPMTHAEAVRKTLLENGFEIDKELTVEEDRHIYLIISAKYVGKALEKSPHWIYLGDLLNSEIDSDKKYVDKIIDTIRVKAEHTDDKQLHEALRSIEECLK